LGALAAIAAVIAVLITRDPTEPIAVAAVVIGSALAVACVVALLGIAVEERDAALARPRRRPPDRGRAVRRGVEAGVLLAALGLLRAVDGLSLITGGFVLVGFVLAELVLTASSSAARSG
jgi:heme O synthase-like polyprenyltransferase